MQIIDDGYNKFFHRQIELWGEGTQKSLLSKKVLIIGSGGLGCSLGIAGLDNSFRSSFAFSIFCSKDTILFSSIKIL